MPTFLSSHDCRAKKRSGAIDFKSDGPHNALVALSHKKGVDVLSDAKCR
jgi:hypothetical protein